MREYHNTAQMNDLHYKSTLHNYDGHQADISTFQTRSKGDLAFVTHIFGLRLKLRLEAMTHLPSFNG